LSRLLNRDEFLNGSMITFQDSLILSQHAYVDENTSTTYYPQGWLRFKFYVPKGTKVHFVISTKPNTTIRINSKFRGDNNNEFDFINPIEPSDFFDPTKDLISEDQPTVIYPAINTFSMDFENLSKGGWVYLAMVEDSKNFYSEHGFIEQAELAISYSIELLDKEAFISWLNNTTFLRDGGDPSANTEKLIEIDRPALDKIVKREIKLSTGEYKYNLSELKKIKFNLTSDSQSTSQNTESVVEEEITIKPTTVTQTSKESVEQPQVPLQGIEKEIVDKTFDIKGYWIKYGDYWIYVSKESRKVYLYDSNLKYQKELKNLKAIVLNGEIKVVSKNDSSQNIPDYQNTNTPSTQKDKKCPSGYTYDPESGLCILNESSDYQDNDTGVETEPSNNTLPTPIQNTNTPSTQKDKKCPSGYTYDPESGLCLE